jgi:hypothetical protein
VSLSDDLEELSKSSRCATCEWRATRTTEEQARIDAQMSALSGTRTRQQVYGQYADLHNICTKHGLQTDLDIFRHHCKNHVQPH